MAGKEEQDEAPIEIIEGDGAATELKVETPKDGVDGGDKIVSGDEGAEELKRRLDEANARVAAAEDVARVATEKAGQAVAAVEDGEMREIQTSIDVTKRNLELARTQYRNARAANDVDAELEATEAIAQSKADLNALEAGKAAREHAKKNPQPQPQFRQDPVEVIVESLQGRWPQSAAWIRAHPEIARDPNKWEATQSASRIALARGLKADTPEYFAHVEGTLQANGFMPIPQANNGNGNGAVVKTEETALSQASRPVQPAAAPVSRQGGAPGQPRPGVIRLTRDQAEMAELSYPHLPKDKAHREYAKSMVDLKANGKMN